MDKAIWTCPNFATPGCWRLSKVKRRRVPVVHAIALQQLLKTRRFHWPQGPSAHHRAHLSNKQQHLGKPFSNSPRDFKRWSCTMFKSKSDTICLNIMKLEAHCYPIGKSPKRNWSFQRFHVGRKGASMCEWCPPIPTCYRFLWENPYDFLGCSLMLVMRPIRPYHPPLLSIEKDDQPAVAGKWTMIQHH